MRVKNNTQRFEVFVRDLQESFWGDFQGQTRQMLKKLLETDAEQRMAEYLGLRWHERTPRVERVDYRNGFYERDYVTPLGVIRLRIPRTRERSFLPRCIAPLERRAPEVAELIRQAFLRGISTRQVGRVVATLTGESISAQTVSKLTRVLDQAVQAFHQRPLVDEWAYLVLDGVWLKVRRAFGPQRVLLLVAYGIRRDGQRGLHGKHLQLIITDGCPGLARALETVYPRVRHQRCWVHKMRNILEKAKRRDEKQIKSEAQKIYLAANRAGAKRAFERFRFHWRLRYPAMVRQLERDLPELLHFFDFPRHLWRKLRTTNVIERCFVEVRRRTRPMVVFTNVASVERIIYAIFSRFNEDWKNHALELFTQAA